jgi:hypothetical protein
VSLARWLELRHFKIPDKMAAKRAKTSYFLNLQTKLQHPLAKQAHQQI